MGRAVNVAHSARVPSLQGEAALDDLGAVFFVWAARNTAYATPPCIATAPGTFWKQPDFTDL